MCFGHGAAPALPRCAVEVLAAGARRPGAATPTAKLVFSPSIGCPRMSPRRGEQGTGGLCRPQLDSGGLAQPRSRSPAQEESGGGRTQAGALKLAPNGRRTPTSPARLGLTHLRSIRMKGRRA